MKLEKENFDILVSEKLKENRDKDIEPKNTTIGLYKRFKEYLYLRSFSKIINEDNFINYFEDFLEINYGNNRIDFCDKTKTKLMQKSAALCTICGIPTIYINRSGEAESIGIACHIISASKYGPRTDLESRKKPNIIKDEDNGFWGCPTCHVKIDNDEDFYTIKYLKKQRKEHYEFVSNLEKENISLKNYFEIRNNLLELKIENIKLIAEGEQRELIVNQMYEKIRESEKLYIEKMTFIDSVILMEQKIAKNFKNSQVTTTISEQNVSIKIDPDENMEESLAIETIEEIKKKKNIKDGKFFIYEENHLRAKQYAEANNIEYGVFVSNSSMTKFLTFDHNVFQYEFLFGLNQEAFKYENQIIALFEKNKKMPTKLIKDGNIFLEKLKSFSDFNNGNILVSFKRKEKIFQLNIKIK